MTTGSVSALLQPQSESQLADRYEALVRVSQAIAAHRDPHELFSTLAGELRQVVRFDFIGIAQFDQATSRATWLLAKCDQAREEPPAECTPQQTLTCWVYQQQQPLVIPFVEHEMRFPRMTEWLKECDIRSACALPLTTVHRRLGILALGSRHPDAYSDDEVSFLSLVANQVALAVDDALNLDASRLAQTELRQKQEELQQERDRLKLLLDVNNGVVSNLELRDVLRAITATIRRVMQCDVVSVDLPNAEGTHLQIYALDFPESKGYLKEESVMPIDGTPPGQVFRTGETRVMDVVGDAASTKNCVIFKEGIKSGCLLPLNGRNRRVLGVLGLGSRQRNAFSQNQVDFVAQVANQVAIAVDNALAYSQIADLKDKLAQEKLYLEDEIRSEMNFDDIVGTSPALRRVLRQVETVAPTGSAVLILGETGTGKELIARAIHNLSRRKDRTFVKLNCAAIPTGLLESELFGHEKGAFTGAIAQRIGRFELANQGTIFLDEIAEIPLELQPKLLRVLQEREFERLGSSRTLRTDARLVAATNRDLAAMVEEQKFRADLFYRVNVFPVQVPALRERREDIPVLVRHFAQQFARRNNKIIETIPSEAMEALVRYHWPGNVRELQNVVERAVILSSGPVLKVQLSDLKAAAPLSNRPERKDTLDEAQRKHILAALEETNWVVGGPNGAAARLGLNRSTLQFRMKKLGISRPGR
ncbi:MAG: GAF domain-containing protein [Acidobacteria bacterium]|nr:MAG: GAF domain-containing protein [Acidobacteriota bacterium]